MVENISQIITLGHCIIDYHILHIFVSIFLHLVLSLGPVLFSFGVAPLGFKRSGQVQDVGTSARNTAVVFVDLRANSLSNFKGSYSAAIA